MKSAKSFHYKFHIVQHEEFTSFLKEYTKKCPKLPLSIRHLWIPLNNIRTARHLVASNPPGYNITPDVPWSPSWKVEPEYDKTPIPLMETNPPTQARPCAGSVVLLSLVLLPSTTYSRAVHVVAFAQQRQFVRVYPTHPDISTTPLEADSPEDYAKPNHPPDPSILSVHFCSSLSSNFPRVSRFSLCTCFSPSLSCLPCNKREKIKCLECHLQHIFFPHVHQGSKLPSWLSKIRTHHVPLVMYNESTKNGTIDYFHQDLWLWGLKG